MKRVIKTDDGHKIKLIHNGHGLFVIVEGHEGKNAGVSLDRESMAEFREAVEKFTDPELIID